MPVFQRLGNNIVQRIVVKEVADSKYLEMIQTVEEEFYIESNGKEHLQKELLRKRYEERTRVRGNPIKRCGLFRG